MSLGVLLTNDDGIEAEGLQTLRRELLKVPGIRLAVIAPDGNRSASARSITTRRPLWVEQIDFADGTVGYATDGTPVDCVRLAQLGLVEDFQMQLVVSGINHGVNLGDDITYSGTVAAAFEAVILGLPGIAVSQQSSNRELDYRVGQVFNFEPVAKFVASLVTKLDQKPLPEGTLLNVNAPADKITGVAVTKLGKRIYRDELTLKESSGNRHLYRIYGEDPSHEETAGSDILAVAEGKIALTPIHFDLTDLAAIEVIKNHNLGGLLE